MSDPRFAPEELSRVLGTLNADLIARHVTSLLRGINLLPGQLRELDRQIDQMAAIERLLPADADVQPTVAACFGMVLGSRCLTGANARLGDRDEALRRLRLAHRHGRADTRLTGLAQMVLVRLLVADAMSNDQVSPHAPDRGEDDGRSSTPPGLIEACEIVDWLDANRSWPDDVLDIVIDQLAALERHMPGGARARALVVPRLGLLLAERSLASGSLRPGDRDGALRHLRWAHHHGHGGNQLAVRVRLALLKLLAPEDAMSERGRTLDELVWDIFAAGSPGEDGDIADAVLESCDILDRLSCAPLAQDLRQRLHDYRQRLELSRRVFSRIGEPWTISLEDLWDRFGIPPGHSPLLDDRDVEPLAPSREAFIAAVDDRIRGVREGDLEHLERSAERLRELIRTLPPDDPYVPRARSELSTVLSNAARLTGSRQDREAALAVAHVLWKALARESRELSPLAQPHRLAAAVSRAFEEMKSSKRGGDDAELPRLIDELRWMYQELPPDDVRRFHVGLAWCAAHQGYGVRTGDAEYLRTAERHLRQAHSRGAYVSSLRVIVYAQLSRFGREPAPGHLDEAAAELERAVAAMPMFPDHEAGLRMEFGLALLDAGERLQDPQRLDEGIAELARVRELAASGLGPADPLEALWPLARAYARRSRSGDAIARADLDAALKIGLEALQRLGSDILLQSGTEHGLATARQGADMALTMAHWAVKRRGPALPQTLELGRAMVLRAVALSDDVPEMLARSGHAGLAQEWRRATSRDLTRPGAAEDLLWGQLDSPPASFVPLIPSTLRRRALKALSPHKGGGVQDVITSPTMRQLGEVAAAAGLDALVYLVPGQNGSGYALLIRPTNQSPVICPLPHLNLSEPALQRYLDTAAARSQLANQGTDQRQRNTAEEAWRQALEELCDWAWPAAVGALLNILAPAKPPRIVLVPCDRLGVVPWHAARRRDAETGIVRYACQDAIFTYAPSALELMRAASRKRLPLAERQVLVADPESSLVWPAIEVEALRAAYYPNAQLYGQLFDQEPDAVGSPEDLLAVLPGPHRFGASLIHFSCHGIAGPSPSRSALRLAGGELTVARLLDLPPRDTARRAGPLIVLGACETDLSTRDHDEALTLSTALVSRGAADVVGSRWAAQDGATAVMMSVFHHHLALHGHSPADALRAAQLWMLDPHRQPPPTLTDPALRTEATRSDLHQLHLWAAFTHQGNPAPARA